MGKFHCLRQGFLIVTRQRCFKQNKITKHTNTKPKIHINNIYYLCFCNRYYL